MTTIPVSLLVVLRDYKFEVFFGEDNPTENFGINDVIIANHNQRKPLEPNCPKRELSI
jgi:hypothetical protein